MKAIKRNPDEVTLIVLIVFYMAMIVWALLV